MRRPEPKPQHDQSGQATNAEPQARLSAASSKQTDQPELWRDQDPSLRIDSHGREQSFHYNDSHGQGKLEEQE